MLLEHGAKIDAQTDSGETALHGAVKHVSSVQLVRLLLEHGADVNARNKSGWTASQLAGEREILQLLSEYVAKSVE
jgi:ankyrin repeat protein